jgi:hypothetical protein
MGNSEPDELSRRQAAEVVRAHHFRDGAIQFINEADVTLKQYPGGKKQREGTIVEVVFDSSVQLNIDDVRSAGKQTRQILFRAGPYHVDVQIEVIPDTARLVITAQILNARDPGRVCRDAQVTLSNRRGNLLHLVTNEFGEFRWEIENSGDLELILRSRPGKPIIISLQDALR